MVEAANKNQDGSLSIEEDQELVKDDADLLAFQKQRSMPRVSLSSVGLDGEKLEVEIDDFGKIGQENLKVGMGAAGTEEKIIRQLHKQGSFDSSKLMEIGQSPLLKAGGPLDAEDGGELVDDEADK